MGLFDGKVVVITGAGGGIGRSHALSFAQEGAKVVVNDLGTTPDGSGKGTTSMADKVVEEIKQMGGVAVANYDTVATMEGGENILKIALENYGRVDILINNAGILRDKTIIKMEEKNWDEVLNVHLKGTFACTRAAARIMKEQGTGGRIINTVSAAGLLGNFGQSNYGSAKAGIYGFTRVAALELRRYGITVNAIAPMAKTRLTEGIDLIPSEFTPEQATPMVLFLASDKAEDITGRIFGIHGQHLFEYQMKTTPGVEKSGKDLWTVDEIVEKFEEITKLSDETKKVDESTTSIIDTLFQVMPQAFRPEKVEGWNAKLHFQLAGADDWCVEVQDGKVSTSKEIPEKPSCVIKMSADTLTGLIDGSLDATKAFIAGKIEASRLPDLVKFPEAFSFRKLQELLKTKISTPETLLTSTENKFKTFDSGLDPSIIGRVYTGAEEVIKPERIMAYAEATNESNPRYFEKDQNKLAVPPVFPVTMLLTPMNKIITDDTLKLDISRMVHAEHEILYYRPLKPNDQINTTILLDSIDKKHSGDILWAKINGLVDEAPVFEMRAGLFFRKPRKESETKKPKTEMEPVKGDIILSKQIVVTPDQSIRYAEASGDHNPIHIDRDFARAVGLPDIILHGLCTFAFATQAVVDELAGGDPIKVKRVKVRFSKPVFMNDTLTTEAWMIKEDETSKIIGFETKNQNGIAVLTLGEVEILK
ncbi:MAG: SDR family NAD(P)-dependent oxidoreductase [Candidatus Hermodarchaeota archaeon]